MAAFLSAGCAPPRGAANVSTERASAPPSDSAPKAAHFVLASAVTDAPSSVSSSTSTKEAPSRKNHPSGGIGRSLGWFSLSLGVGAGLVAVGTSIMMLHQASVRSDSCNAAKVCTSDGISANDQLAGLGGWNAATWVAAAVGIGVGAYLIVANPATTQKQTAVGIAPSNSGATFMLRSTF